MNIFNKYYLFILLLSSKSGYSSVPPILPEHCNHFEAPRYSHHGIGLSSKSATGMRDNVLSFLELDSSGNVMPKKFNSTPPYECMPDTLYSWTLDNKIGKKLAPFKEAILKSTPQRTTLYTWRTPLGTYGYGNISIRIKLKPNTKFFYWPSIFPPPCDIDKLMMSEKDSIPTRDLVFVRFADGNSEQGNDVLSWAEFDICSTEVVESISLFQPEHLTEMELEIDWITKFRYDQSSLFFYKYTFDEDDNPIDLKKEGLKWGRYKLQKNIELMNEKIINEKSRVFLNLSNLSDTSAMIEHFKTAKPIYFNPD